MGNLSLLQQIVPTQELNRGLLHCRWILYQLSYEGSQPACNVGDLGSIPGLGRAPGEENSYALQYSGLENSMDYIVHRVTKSWTQLSDFQKD